jgi:hypothetical protein
MGEQAAIRVVRTTEEAEDLRSDNLGYDPAHENSLPGTFLLTKGARGPLWHRCA